MKYSSAVLCLAAVLTAGVALAQGPKKIENPVYASWAKFKPGTKVRLETVTQTPTHHIEQTTIFLLTEKTEKEAVVDMTIEIRTEGRKDVGPAQTFTHSRWFTPAPGVDPKAQSKEKGVLEAGAEKITIAGKEYETQWTRTKHRVEAGETFVKAWTCSEVPGGLVKEENETPATKSKTTRELVEVNIAK